MDAAADGVTVLYAWWAWHIELRHLVAFSGVVYLLGYVRGFVDGRGVTWARPRKHRR